MQSRQCSCPPREIRGGAGDIRSAIAIKSDYADAFNNRGVALLGLGRPLPALASYDKALSVRPDHAEALYNRGNLLRQLKRPLEALASYDQAIAIRPGYADAFNALQDLQRPWEAIASYDRSLAIRPTYVESYENKGILLAELGHLASAREALECAIRLDPRRTRSHFHLALVEKTRAGDRHLAVMEDLALRNNSLTVSEQIDLDFALGKAYEDCGDYERSFQFLAAGNALKRKNVVYHEKGALRVFEQIIEAFTGDTIRRRRGVGDPSDTPVFIFGMPRSGSTLIEQILASHPRVFAAGEIDDFEKRDHGSSRRRGKRAAISRELLRRFRRCAAKSRGALPAKRHGRRPGGRSVFLCRPHPSRAAKGANDPCAPRSDRHLLVVLAHWRGVLPQDVMLEVQYEDVVEDIETQIRRILVHCSLELDARGAGGATSRSLRRFFGERPLEPLSPIRRGPRRPP